MRAAALALLVALPLPAVAETAPVVTGSIRPGWQEDDGRRIAALQLSLTPGWKTYWRAPGDAGIPPSFDWSRSENLRSVRLHWPRPQLFEQNGMRTAGYAGEFVLPVEIVPADPSRPVRLVARMEIGVCRDVCMPAELRFEAALADAGAADPAIRAALADRPSTPREAGVRRVSCDVAPIADGLAVEATIDMPGITGREMVVMEPPQGDVWVAEAVVRRDGTHLRARSDMVPPSGAPFALDRGALRLTVLGEDGVAVEIAGCPAP